MLEPGLRKSVTHLRSFAAIPESIHAEKPIEIEFDFFASPRALIGDGKLAAIEVERTEVKAGKARGTGEIYRIPAGLVVSCIGYRTSPIPDVPFDERQGRFANDEGRILARALLRRLGPARTFGHDRDQPAGWLRGGRQDRARISPRACWAPRARQGRPGFDAIAQARGLDVVTFRDWKKIEEAEEQAAREGAPREKFVAIEAMIRALD